MTLEAIQIVLFGISSNTSKFFRNIPIKQIIPQIIINQISPIIKPPMSKISIYFTTSPNKSKSVASVIRIFAKSPIRT